VFNKFLLQLGVWLTQLFAPAEDPRETFASTYQRQRDLMVKVQKALVDIELSKAYLHTKMATVKDKLPQLEAQARQALIDHREDLARLALHRHQVAAADLRLLEQQAREVEQEEQHLSLTEQRLSTQIEAFFTREEIVAARFGVAEAEVRVNEALSGVSRELADLGVALKIAEEKAEYMQARASAIDSLIEEGILELPALPGGERQQISQLEIAQAVEKRLDSLNREIKETNPPQSQAG
jgi:phage shock protein A